MMAILLFGRQPAPAANISAWSPAQPVLAGRAVAARPASMPARSVTSSEPLSLAGDGGFNVLAALDARDGALRRVVIAPGATWSFNATLGDPTGIAIRTVGGVPGGGWCDLASRYVQAVRLVLPQSAVQFVNHVTSSGIRLAGVADEDAVSIWNVDGRPGSRGQSQDLEITNTLAAPLYLRVVEQAGQVVVIASVGG
jgi:hypothetical protein